MFAYRENTCFFMSIFNNHSNKFWILKCTFCKTYLYGAIAFYFIFFIYFVRDDFFFFFFFFSVMTLKRKWFSKVRSRSVIASVIVNDIYIFRRLCPWLSLLFISRCICHDYPSSSTKWLFLYVHIHENNLSRLSFTCSISYFSQMLNRSIFWSKWNTPKNRKKEGEVTKTLQWSQFLLIPPY